jgi:flagellar basal-body rod modification protein FlgD
MNPVSMINGLQQGQPTTGASRQEQMGQEDFLRLMIAQLRNQDPMKPMENGDFLGQMAQFSTVNGIESLNRTMSSITGALAANQALQAATLVDRSALVEADAMEIDEGDSIAGVVELPPDVQYGVVTLRNGAGEPVAQVAVENDGTGKGRFEFGASGDDGEQLPAGRYEVTAEFRSGSQEQAATTHLWGRIDSVSLTGGENGMQVTLKGIGTVSLSNVSEIS